MWFLRLSALSEAKVWQKVQVNFLCLPMWFLRLSALAEAKVWQKVQVNSLFLTYVVLKAIRLV
jgi:hypothetical protein